MKLEEVNQEILICKKCKGEWEYDEALIQWNDKGLGYSTKLCICPHCKVINILKNYEDCSLDLNKDTRYYEYN